MRYPVFTNIFIVYHLSSLLLLFWIFTCGSSWAQTHYAAKDDFELFWTSRLHFPSSGIIDMQQYVWFVQCCNETRILCMLGKPSTNWTTFSALFEHYFFSKNCLQSSLTISILFSQKKNEDFLSFFIMSKCSKIKVAYVFHVKIE